VNTPSARGPLILPFRNKRPQLAAEAWIAPNAVIIGDSEIAPYANIWFGLRAARRQRADPRRRL
jgi:carbonic anhydrase/acetyltransferase-like protein (isoleucine patch superfamily)